MTQTRNAPLYASHFLLLTDTGLENVLRAENMGVVSPGARCRFAVPQLPSESQWRRGGLGAWMGQVGVSPVEEGLVW